MCQINNRLSCDPGFLIKQPKKAFIARNPNTLIELEMKGTIAAEMGTSQMGKLPS